MFTFPQSKGEERQQKEESEDSETKISAYSYDKVPGCITAPVNFRADTLRNYVRTNVGKCRESAQEFVDRQKMMRKVAEALAKKKARGGQDL